MDYYKSLHSKRQVFKNKSSTYTPVTQQSPSMTTTIKEGFAFGIGSSVAHNAITRLFNSPSDTIKNTQDTMCISKTHCNIKLQEYEQCLAQNQNNCKELISEYEKCMRS
jgi:hypothetical protein